MKLILVALAVVLVTVSARGRHRRHRHSGAQHPGGTSGVDDVCNVDVRKAVEKAITLAHDGNVELRWIESVQRQVVAGIKYKFSAYCWSKRQDILLECDYELVHVPWEETSDPYSLLDHSCYVAESSSRRFKEQCPNGLTGGPTGRPGDLNNIDVCDADIRKAAQKAVIQYHGADDELKQIEVAQRQVLDVTTYKLTLYCCRSGDLQSKCDFEMVHNPENSDPYSLTSTACEEWEAFTYNEQCPAT